MFYKNHLWLFGMPGDIGLNVLGQFSLPNKFELLYNLISGLPREEGRGEEKGKEGLT